MTDSKINTPGAITLMMVAVIWEVAARMVQAINFPSFSSVASILLTDASELFPQLGISLWRAAAGFLLALLVMLPLGIFLGRSRRMARFIEPLIDVLRPLPSLAIVPIAMLFAGTGSAAKIMVIFYGASFPILLNAIDATRATHPLMVQMARSYGYSRAGIMQHIDLPAAMPQLVAGIRLSISLALLISVSAEMLLSTDGIGNYLMRAQEQFQVANGLAGILLIAIATLAINTAVQYAERSVLAWHYARQALAKG